MDSLSPTLARITKGNLCSGCGICCSVAAGESLRMQQSDGGFLRPRQLGDITAEEEELIAQICPGINIAPQATNGVDHPIWGRVIAVRTGYSTDSKLRHHASSGGALSALLLYLLETNSVDYVLQIAAARESSLANTIVESREGEQIYFAAGSRYAPSAPLSELRRQLELPGRFAIVGKPCDIAALRALARYDNRINEKIPYLFSFFCAGVPSLAGARQILRELSVQEHEVRRFSYRGNGWPGRATAELKDGRTVSMNYADSWGGILSKHVQFRCKICPDGSGGHADLVCADAWHCDARGFPLFEEEEGRSLILSRTPKGESLLQSAVQAGYLIAKPLDIDEIETMQPSQARRKRLVLSRLCAMALFGRALPHFRGQHLWAAARDASLWENVRSFLGMARRLLTSRA